MEQHLLTRYMNVCRANRMSQNTLMTYERSLTFLCSFLAERNKQMTDATSGDINDFIVSHPEWSSVTIANRLVALRGFFEWAQAEEILPGKNPMRSIKAPKLHAKRNKPFVSADEVRLLKESRRTRRDGVAREGDLRDRCLIALIYDTGLRVAEAVSLNVGHILHMNPERREFIYLGKGGSECSWFVTQPVYELLRSYLQTHPDPQPTNPLFLNRYGERLSVRSVQKMLNVRGEQILGKHLHPHMLRRGFGNAFYEASGHDIYATSQAMHHKSVETTQEYLAVSNDKLKSIMDSSMSKTWATASSSQDE